MNSKSFGTLSDGHQAHLYTLSNNHGMSVSITDFGARIQSIIVPDKNGKPVDVLLGYDDVSVYEADTKFFGAIVGRCANRIGKGDLIVAGQHYALEINNGVNHLHSGDKTGLHAQLWQAQANGEALVLTYISPDGQGNYPGTLTVTVTYSLTDDNGLSISYQAESDADTICNLTNHAYFNLSGYDSGSCLDQTIQLLADYFTPTDSGSIPDGRILPVEGTPMDLRQPTPIGAHIDDDYDQLTWAGGYDHNWVLTEEPDAQGLRKMAYAASDKTGITLTAYTTSPGVQFYAGNYLDEAELGKNGVRFGKRTGFALEAQYYPDAIHHPNFPQPILKKGETYKQKTIYVFGVK